MNGGTCTDLDDFPGFTCDCDFGFSGDTCDIKNICHPDFATCGDGNCAIDQKGSYQVVLFYI